MPHGLGGRFSPLTEVDGDLVESATTALADHIAATITATLPTAEAIDEWC